MGWGWGGLFTGCNWLAGRICPASKLAGSLKHVSPSAPLSPANTMLLAGLNPGSGGTGRRYACQVSPTRADRVSFMPTVGACVPERRQGGHE